MLTQLQTNLETIHSELMDKLTPENLKKDVTLLGVTGTYEGSGSTVEGVKQFSTIEEMQADTTAKEGDLAIVYRSEIQNIKDGDVITSMTFPKTVVFDTAITSSYNARLFSDSIYCDIGLNSTQFYLYDMNGTIPEITYTSSDGITYTRTDSNEDTYEIGETVIEGIDEHICKFIQVDGSTFEGLYNYGNYVDENYIRFPLVEGITFDYDGTTVSNLVFNKSYSDKVEVHKFTELVTAIGNETGTNIPVMQAMMSSDGKYHLVCPVLASNGKITNHSPYLAYDTNKNVIGFAYSTDNYQAMRDYILNLENMTYSYTDIPLSEKVGNYHFAPIDTITYHVSVYREGNSNGKIWAQNMNIVIQNSSANKSPYASLTTKTEDCFDNHNQYNIANTQLTATPEYVYGKEFYGKNGIESGTLQNKENLTKDEVKHRVDIWSNYNSGIICPSDASGMFYGCTNLTTIPLLNTSSVTSMASMFNSCTNLTTIPLVDTSNVTDTNNMFNDCTNLTTIPLLDTSNVTAMDSMFYGCTNLTTIPLLDTSNVTSMASMFNSCTNLTTIPLLNTSSVTSMNYMFQSCTNLTEIPLLDTSSVTAMNSMFSSCTSLSDESLNNILAMCTNATSYTSIKKLKTIGLTSEQATRCQSLSNYQAFITAGWTTGY